MATIDTFCPECDKPVTAEVKEVKDTITCKGRPVVFDGLAAICPECGITIGDARIEGENLERAFAEYEKETGEEYGFV